MKTIKLTEEKIQIGLVILYRIQALIDIPSKGIKKGQKGGFVERDTQVSDDAWVYGNAKVYGDTLVYGDASVSGDAKVYGNAKVGGNAQLDSISSVIVICIAMKYSITVTKNLVFIGCKMFETEKALKINQKQAVELGLPKEYYKPYMEMIKGALKLVK